jgi:sec-independent protein translocase protein TatB
LALIVLGPDRLPALARALGVLVARAQHFSAGVKADIRQQTDFDNLAALGQDVRQEVQQEVQILTRQLETELQRARCGLQALAHPAPENPSIAAALASVPEETMNKETPT